MTVSVDILTTSVRPEMMDFCRWMFARQETTADVRHLVEMSRHGGGNVDRYRCLRTLVNQSDADYFMLGDDDDYVPPGYIQHCLNRMGTTVPDWCYGEIPKRAYLMTGVDGGAYGESTKRQSLFPTFVLYHAMARPYVIPSDTAHLSIGSGPHSDHLIVMRGLMADPSTAVTARKNTYNPKHWPHLDPDHDKLREWLADDPEAFDRYMEMSR